MLKKQRKKRLQMFKITKKTLAKKEKLLYNSMCNYI